MRFVRGGIQRSDLGHGEQPWAVVSNNARNNALGGAPRLTVQSPGSSQGTGVVVPLSQSRRRIA